MTILGKLITLFGGFAKSIGTILKVIGKAKTGMLGLSKVFGLLTSPVGLIVAAIAGLTAAFIYFYKTNDEFREKVNTAWQKVIDIFRNNVMPLLESLCF